MPRLVEGLRKIAWAAAGTALALVAVELAFLLVLHLIQRDPIYRYDPTLGWRIAPNLKNAHRPYYRIDTDSHGFRIGRRDPRRLTQFDVMILGDSFCFGSGLEEEPTLVGIMRSEYPHLRIANACVPGFGTDQEYLMLSRYSDLLERGSLVILFTYINDFEDVRARLNEVEQKPWFELNGGSLELHKPRSALNSLCWSSEALHMFAFMGWLALAPHRAVYGDDALAERLYARLVAQIAAAVRAHGARLLVVYTSARDAGSAQAHKWSDAARRAAAGSGTGFVNLDDNPLAAAPGMYLERNIHWNEKGSKANYEYLLPRVAAALGGFRRTAQ